MTRVDPVRVSLLALAAWLVVTASSAALAAPTPICDEATNDLQQTCLLDHLAGAVDDLAASAVPANTLVSEAGPAALVLAGAAVAVGLTKWART